MRSTVLPPAPCPRNRLRPAPDASALCRPGWSVVALCFASPVLGWNMNHRRPDSVVAIPDRPRERLDALGPAALSDVELISLLLRTGDRGRDVMAVAADLLEHRGGLRGLSRAAARELSSCSGIGPAKGASVRAALEIGRRLAGRRLEAGAAIGSPADVYRHFHPSLRDERQERFFVILLDARHRVLRTEVISQGTLTASLVHPREVFRPALREAAAALVLVHNHPSGDPTPSHEDREVTSRLAKAGEILGVRVLDHVVVAERGFCSLRDEGALGPDSTAPAQSAKGLM